MVASLVTTGPTAPDIPLPELLRRQSTHWAPAAGPFISDTCDFNCLTHTQLFTEKYFPRIHFSTGCRPLEKRVSGCALQLDARTNRVHPVPPTIGVPQGKTHHPIASREGRLGERDQRSFSWGVREELQKENTLRSQERHIVWQAPILRDPSRLPPPPPRTPPTPVPFSQAHREDR